MSPFRRRLFQLLGLTAEAAARIPARGDAVEEWLKAQRDQMEDRFGRLPAWYTLDDLLDTYRLHADTGIPLGEHVCEGRVIGDCECLEQPNHPF